MAAQTLADLFCRGEDLALCNAADAIGAALAARGLRPGDRVAAVMADDELALATVLGIATAGCAVVPLPTHGAHEALRDSGARLVLAGPDGLATARDAAGDLPIPVVELRLDERDGVLLDGEPNFEALHYRADLDDVALAPVGGAALTHSALVETVERHPDGPRTALLALVRQGGERVVANAA